MANGDFSPQNWGLDQRKEGYGGEYFNIVQLYSYVTNQLDMHDSWRSAIGLLFGSDREKYDQPVDLG